jgi:hypothetical protein
LARLDELIAAFNQRFILNLWNQGTNYLALMLEIVKVVGWSFHYFIIKYIIKFTGIYSYTG